MGVVYRAHDTKLNREVALKVLPDSFANDADRVARFTREAQTLASLNHPNIAQIHGLEESDGASALVMELVEGDELSRRILRGAMPIHEALPIARQIAEALEAAHEQGIVHRDLKPANVMVRADGTVKVLDFGLAKATEPVSWVHGEGTSEAPTVTTPALETSTGAILGTAAYMSPEQARGETVDGRADVWAFGCVLFEMLAGRRPFDGKDMIEMIGGILRLEPQWDALPPTVPARVSQALRVCLRKDLRQRAQAIGDVRLALDGAFETSIPPPLSSHTSGRRGLVAALIATAVGMVAMTFPAVRHLRETPPLPPETRTDIVTPVTADPNSFALSPDGRQIAFVANGDGVARLWLRSLADTTAHFLPGTEGATSPFWSPDSRSIAFFAEGTLKRLDLGGGAPQILAGAAGARGGSWNRDGVILFSLSSGPLLRVEAIGGQSVSATALDRQSSHRYPFFLPDGRHFLFFATGATGETTGIYLGALDSPGAQRLTQAQTPGVYLSPEWLLWVRADTLVAQRLSLERKALVGEPVTLADSIFADANSPVPVSISATGVVAYRAGAVRRRQLTWFDRTGTALGTLGAADENRPSNPRISPDGRRVVVSRSVQGNFDIWLLDGTRSIRLTFDSALDQFPVWSPDGSQIAFQSDRKTPRSIYRRSSSAGAGSEDLLLESDQITVPSDWSADGKFLLYYRIDSKSARDLWVLPLQGARAPRVVLNTPFEERWAALSQDGRWMAYMSDESGRSEIYVRPFIGPTSDTPASAAQWQVSAEGGIFPRWRPDGKELYFIGPDGQMMAAPIMATGTTVTAGLPVMLFSTRIAGGGADNTEGPQYDVSRDGRFLINTEQVGATTPITLLMNWNPAAAKK
jgi:eukaryotic-like serine/threonine-protein kinase